MMVLLKLPRALFVTLVVLVTCAPAFATTRVWNGSSPTNPNWSLASNWDNGVPVDGDSIVFPITGGPNSRNDLTDLHLETITIDAINYLAVRGNLVSLSAGLVSQGYQLTWGISIRLTGSQTFDFRKVTYFGAEVYLGGYTLTMNSNGGEMPGDFLGAGNVVIEGTIFDQPFDLSGGANFTGSFVVEGGLLVTGVIMSPAVTVRGGALYGDGTVPQTTVERGFIEGGFTQSGRHGPLSTGSLSLVATVSASPPRLYEVIRSATEASGYDQVRTTGTVTLSNADLSIILESGSPFALGTQFRIVDNDGIDPVVGTFNGLPEGAQVEVLPDHFRISYVGGTGNDIVLTEVANTGTTLMSSRNPANATDVVTYTAHVTSGSGTPTGSVTFEEGGTVLGTGVLDGSGTASIAIMLPPGVHSITAHYLGEGTFAESVSAPLSETITPVVPTMNGIALLALMLALAAIGWRSMRA